MSEPAALVTGAGGFLGQAIVRTFARAGVPVVATDRLSPGELRLRPGTPPEAVDYVRRDLADEELDDLVRQVGGVVHAAALTPGDERDGETGDRLLRVNLTPLAGLLRAARTSTSCSRLLLVSSAGVYHQAREGVLAEDDADGGASLYGAAKLAAEVVARRYAALYDLELAAVRPTSLFGAGERERPSRPRVTPFARLVGCALSGEPVRVERPRALADWLSVDDAAEALLLLWRAPTLAGASFNLSSGRPRPLSDVVAAVTAVAGLRLSDDAPTVVDGGDDRPARISNDRIREAVGWRPSRSLEDGVRDLVEDLRDEAGASS